MKVLEFSSETGAQLEQLLADLEAGSVPLTDSLPGGSRVQVAVCCGDTRLELFGIVSGNTVRLTEDPGDLRFQVQRFREALGEEEAASPSTEGEVRSSTDASQVDTAFPVPSDDTVTPCGTEVDSSNDRVDDSVAESSDDGAWDEEAWQTAERESESRFDSSESDEEEDADAGNASTDSPPAAASGVRLNPMLQERKRIQGLPVPKKLRLAEDGDLMQRQLLFRMYGKLVFEALLRNPKLTEMEVAKLAKLGTMPSLLLQRIAQRPDWLRSERVRNNLLANPRLPTAIAQKVVARLNRLETRALLGRRDLPAPVQIALRNHSAKLG